MKGIRSILVIVLVCVITGCGKGDNNKLIGSWNCNFEGVKSTYVFNKDKTGEEIITVDMKSSTQKYTYSTRKDKLLITFEGDTDVFEYGYRFDGENLVLKDTFDEEFTCKK